MHEGDGPGKNVHAPPRRGTLDSPPTPAGMEARQDQDRAGASALPSPAPLHVPDDEGGGDGRYRLRLGWGRFPGWRGELLIVLGLLAAACVLTWPLVVTLGQATGARGDYFNNLWNAWWVKHSLVEGHSPYWTDYLYFPEGISLRRHTLSLLNSLTLALFTTAVDEHQAFNLLLLLHFALSAWCFSLLARYVSGSTAGGLLGGLVYSFCPFHYFYLCQINVFSFEFLPLGLLFFVKHLREGGARNLTGVVLSLAGMALTVEYYVVYCYLALGVLLLCARGWARGVAPRLGARRVLVSGALGAAVVALAAWPLLAAALGAEGQAELQTSANAVEKSRYNDLLGFFWIGGDEECTVSWPTMLGYSTLLVLLAGWRRVLAHWPWLVLGASFLVLSLGEELALGRQKLGIPLPYRIFRELPVLSMLRKSDRCYLLVQLAACVSLAAAWAGLAERLRSTRARTAAWSLCAGVLMLELTGAPFQRFTVPTSPHMAELRADKDVTAVMELPPMPLHVMNGRYDYYQTLHEKKSTLGYTTSIALTPLHDERLETLSNLYLQFIREQNRVLPRLAANLGVDRIVHYKTLYVSRPRDPSIDGITLWQPFFFVRHPLVFVRQVGEYQETPYPAGTLEHIELLLGRILGAPLFEDEHMVVYDVPRPSAPPK